MLPPAPVLLLPSSLSTNIPSIPHAELGAICKAVSRLSFLPLTVLSSDFSHRVEENDFSVFSIFMVRFLLSREVT